MVIVDDAQQRFSFVGQCQRESRDGDSVTEGERAIYRVNDPDPFVVSGNIAYLLAQNTMRWEMAGDLIEYQAVDSKVGLCDGRTVFLPLALHTEGEIAARNPPGLPRQPNRN